MTAGQRRGTPDQRRFTRIVHGGEVRYRLGDDQHLEARCLDIGWGGAALRLGRYLRPGTAIEVFFATGEGQGQAVRGRLVWCRPLPEAEFLAGVEANLDHGETVFSLSAVLLRTVSAGEGQAVQCACARTNPQEAPRWALFRAAC
ncbi:MAG: PilZ domain-containing protein [Candidatus Hydrogenedentes bacterium]|nr:PilZ domain-containing protein [Candidatus Hydrogenedentota bacterium]